MAIAPRGVGAFELLELLGAGSSGAVYRARHRDNGMLAAVKLLRIDAQGHGSIDRFRREARIVSRMTHPGIVRVIDSGVHEQAGVGTPYLVCELVEGEPFSAALGGRPTTEVLQAFAEVCDAVAFAHRAGVLHRDLKPANVLVDAGCHPHVLDFGCARCLDLGAAATLPGQVFGTPAFMSPEQAAGRPVDARSDQWSLGALLFDALAGQPPHPLAGLAVAAALQLAAHSEPRRLRSLRPELPVDLGAIVDKALSVDPAWRYPDVEALARDVRRLLAGEPVEARPPSVFASTLHFARRHRVATAVGLVVAVSVTVGGAIAAVQWRRAVAAERHLEQAAADAFTAVQAGTEFAAQLAERNASAEEQLRVLEPAIVAVQRLQQIAGAPRRWLHAEAGLREAAADFALRLNRLEENRAQRLRIVEIERELLGTEYGDPGDLARALVKLGDCALGAHRDQAIGPYGEAHQLLLVRAKDGSLGSLDDLGWSYHRLAGLARWQGHPQEALSLCEQQIALVESLFARSPDPLRHFAMAIAICEWHRSGGGRGDPELELRRLERALECAEVALRAEPDRLAFVSAAQQAKEDLAMCLVARGEVARARGLLARHLELAEAVRRQGGGREADLSFASTTDFVVLLAREVAAAGKGTESAELARWLAERAVERLAGPTNATTAAAVEQLCLDLGCTDLVTRVRAVGR